MRNHTCTVHVYFLNFRHSHVQHLSKCLKHNFICFHVFGLTLMMVLKHPICIYQLGRCRHRLGNKSVVTQSPYSSNNDRRHDIARVERLARDTTLYKYVHKIFGSCYSTKIKCTRSSVVNKYSYI